MINSSNSHSSNRSSRSSYGHQTVTLFPQGKSRGMQQGDQALKQHGRVLTQALSRIWDLNSSMQHPTHRDCCCPPPGAQLVHGTSNFVVQYSPQCSKPLSFPSAFPLDLGQCLHHAGKGLERWETINSSSHSSNRSSRSGSRHPKVTLLPHWKVPWPATRRPCSQAAQEGPHKNPQPYLGIAIAACSIQPAMTAAALCLRSIHR